MKKIIIILSFLLTVISFQAQERDSVDLMSKAEKRSCWAAKYNKLCDRYNALLVYYQRLDSLFQDTLHYYEGLDSYFVEQRQLLEQERKSIQPSLNKIHHEAELIASEKAKLENEKSRFDSIMFYLCDRQLNKRYVKKDVEAVVRLCKMSDSSKREEKFDKIFYLLQNYERFYLEVRQVIKDAQKESETCTAAVAKKYQEIMKNRMKQTEYYKKHYDKYYIAFLDNQIDVFFYCLEHQTPGEYDFSLILDKLFPEIK